MEQTVGQQILTLLKAQYPDASLYEFHNILGVTSQNIYQLDQGRHEISGGTLLIACDILGIDPQPWLIKIEIRKCRSPKVRETLKKMLDKLDSPGTRAASAFFGVLIAFSFIAGQPVYI